tara:strand:- start:676 stop:1548 length:873 start_codon:yes stop_codon:yes gene_type:complete
MNSGTEPASIEPAPPSKKRPREMARGRNATNLAEKNPLYFDKLIVYDEATHLYTVGGHNAPISVTKLIDRAYDGESFDGRVVATRCLSSWKAGRGNVEYVKLIEGMSDEDAISAILQKWNETSKLGTLLHKVAEMSYNGTPMDPSEYTSVAPEAAAFEQFKQSSGMTCKRTELSLFYALNGNVLAAGQLDLFMRDPDSRPVIIDLKRTDKNLSPYARPGKAVPLFEALKDTPFHRYSLQNSMYSVMYEALTGEAVEDLYVLQIPPGGGVATLLKCLDLRKEARVLLDNLS